MTRWTFKLFEHGNIDALDLVLTPAISYGWWRAGARWGSSPWFWFAAVFFAWAVAVGFMAARRAGRARWPWEPRS